MEHKKHIYKNPITGRNIHEYSKIYRELKKNHYKLKKSPCLYNEKAAKKCIEKIMKHYPKLPIILSKTLPNDITVIRNKNGLVNGVVNSNGQMYKLEYPIRVDTKVPELVTVSEDHFVILNNKLNSSDIISSDYILNKLNNQVSGENVTYNPLHDNYTQVLTKPILNEINKQVIPETLPTNGSVAGVIRNQDNLDEITGYINEKNEALKLSTTLNVKVSELQKELSAKDTEINNLKNKIQQKIQQNSNNSNLSKLNSLLITKENEKQQIEKQCTEKIRTLYSQLGELNVKIPKLEQSSDYYYSLIKRTLEKWNPIEDDKIDKSYATWLKNLFVGNKMLKKTDNIDENLDILVERANMYANSKRTNIELQKINDEYKSSLDKLNEQLLEYPYQKYQIEELTKYLEKVTQQYKNSKITRDLLIASYEKSIKGYLNAIESLKENNVNIGVEMGLLKNKYNDLKELQEQLKNSQDTDSEYNFITKYFNVSQDYSTLSNLITKHELEFQELQDKNNQLEDDIKNLQRKLKETSNVNIVNNLDRYKKAFKEIQTKYNNLIQENNNHLKKIIECESNKSIDGNLSELTKIQSELKQCKEDKLRKEEELSEQASNFISLPRSVTDTLKSENISVQDSIKKDLIQKDCTGYLTNEVGAKFILKWNDHVQKCTQEEIKCNENEMYSESKGKCLPCEDYDLIWDPITKKCIIQSVGIIVDKNNNIIGETEDDGWTEIRRKKNKPWK